MRRIQVYLDDELWGVLHSCARREKTTISELVRQAVRERYWGSRELRLSAMQSFVGIRKSRVGEPDVSEEVRSLRKGPRISRRGD